MSDATAIVLSRVKAGHTYASVRAEFSDVIRAGRIACYDGQRLDTCPHPDGSDESVMWRSGWHTAHREMWD